MLNKLLDDLRFPIGLLFSIFSLILIVTGLIQPQSVNKDMNINLNIAAGGVMGIFGVFMLLSAVWSVRSETRNKGS